MTKAEEIKFGDCLKPFGDNEEQNIQQPQELPENLLQGGQKKRPQ